MQSEKQSPEDKAGVKRMSFFDVSLETANWLYAWGWKFTILGAAIAFIATVALMFGTRVRDHDFEWKISQLNKSAADESERAAIAIERTAILENKTAEIKADTVKANERAAKAEKEAAEAKLALEKFKAPRLLTKLQQDILRDKLKPFSGITIDIIRYGATTEIARLSELIGAPLNEAGWSPRTWNDISGGSATGVLVMTKLNATETIVKASNALIVTLRELSIDCSPWAPPKDWSAVPGAVSGPSWEADKVAPIRLIIGAKPQ